MKKIIIGFFMIFMSFSIASSQYIYFSGDGKNNNGFQQGCDEELYLYYTGTAKFGTLQERDVGLAAFVEFDMGHVSYSTTPSLVFQNYSTGWYNSDGFPKFITQDLLQINLENIGQRNQNAGTGGTLNFKPKYNINDYTAVFGFRRTASQNSQIGGSIPGLWFERDTNTDSVDVKREPCEIDSRAPVVTIHTYANNSTSHLAGSDFKFSVTESSSNGTTPYYYNSNNIWTGNGNSNTVDGVTINNQTGVNPNSIYVTFSGNGNTGTFRVSDGNISLTTGVAKTWGNKDRDYSGTIVSSNIAKFFGVEKELKISVYGKDWNNKRATGNITINSPKPPYVTGDIYPENDDEYIPYLANIEFDIKDDWAGVSGDSIVVTLSGVDGTDFSPETAEIVLMNCLNETESDCGTLGKNGGYHIVASHSRFPGSGNIKVTVNASDLGGKSMEAKSREFQVAPNCSEMAGCCDPVEIWYGENKVIDGYTGSELTVSGAKVTGTGYSQYTLSGVEYTGWIFEIDCHQVESALTLYTGVESESTEIISGLLLDELVLSGANPETIKAELSGNQLTLSYWVDGAEITQISPAVGTTGTSRTVSLNWTLNDMDSYDWLSGFVVAIYTGDNSENIVSSEFVQYVSGTDMTTTLNTIEDGDYYWSVYVVDKAGRTGGIVSTGAFAVKVEYLVGAMTVTPIYPTGDVNTGIVDFVWSTGGQIDNTMVGEFSGFIVSVYSGSDILWTGWTDTTGWTNVTGLENGTYNWTISVVDRDGRLDEKGREIFEVQLEKEYTVRVYPGSRSDDNLLSNYGDLRFYSGGQLYLRIENFYTNNLGIGQFTGRIDNGSYTIVYKGQSHLASYLSGLEITDNVLSFDFTTGDKLYGTYEYGGYQRQYVGDLKNIAGNYGFQVVGNAIAIITASGFINGGVDLLDPRNLNGDISINGSDIGLIGQNFEKEDIYKKSISW